jgi:hypothetical protein
MAVEEPGRVAESAAPHASARLALWILVALAVLGPWPFGSTPPWAVRAVTLIALATAIVASLAQARHGTLFLPRVPLWPVAILVALGFIQLVPLPAGLHAILAPGSAEVWHPDEPAAAALLTATARPISITPPRRRRRVGTTGGRSPSPFSRRRRSAAGGTMTAVTWTIVGAGTWLRSTPSWREACSPDAPLRLHPRCPTVSPFGPFVNKNHFAGYVEMPALLALGLGRGLWRQHLPASGEGTPSPSPGALAAFGASVTMVMAVLLSLSRGGALGVVSGIGVLALLEYVTARRRGSVGRILLPVGLAVLLGLIVALMPGEVHERLLGIARRDDSSTVYRVAIWKDSLRAWIASPVLGQGLGAFADVIPRFKTTAGQFRVEHPESEPIEISAEGGVIALLAAATALGLLFVRVVPAIRGHRDRVQRGIVTGALAGLAALAVHGLVDFNLRIPSNAVLFLTLAAVAAAPLGTVARARGHRWASSPPWWRSRGLRARPARGRCSGRASALKVSVASGAPPSHFRCPSRRRPGNISTRPADPEAWRWRRGWPRAGRPEDAARSRTTRSASIVEPGAPRRRQSVTDGLPGR